MSGGRYRIGIDVGGTFTDFVLYNVESGDIATLKVPTTPEDPSTAILNGISKLHVDLADVSDVTHGTTLATNALIERRGARTAFLVTEGFRDTLEIRRANRQELFSAHWVPPLPLIPRRHRMEIRERLYWDGEIAVPLDEKQVDDVIETLRARDIESVAICFLHAYQHPVHEERVRAKVREAMPDAFVTISSECSQEFREFERGSTVAANALIGPKVDRYMRDLSSRIREAGLVTDVAIMQSNGGTCTIEEAGALPVKLARSGPAAGAMALESIAELTGHDQIVGIDIGGTSADVSVVVDGRPRWTSPLRIEWGVPLLMPSVDVVSIGAGGGSLASIDAGDVLHMGPESAGADPGPACYGRGGTRPTATDAHVVLGHLSADGLGAATDFELRPELASRAIQNDVATPLGLGVEEAAAGMLRILDSAMLQAVRFLTLERGYDPREFALVAFGGGGPLHVVQLARELGISTAIVPVAPGVLSAWGMLTVDMVQDRSWTILRRLRAVDNEELGKVLADLRSHIEEAFVRQGIRLVDVTFEYFLDMQYYGQTYSLPVGLSELESRIDVGADESIRLSEEGAISVPLDTPAREGPVVTDEVMARAVETFHREHEREYGHADRDQELQVVHARVFGRAKVDHPALEAQPEGDEDPSKARVGSRAVRFEAGVAETDVYQRERLEPGNQIQGPAIVQEASSTMVLPPAATAKVDRFGNLIIQTGGSPSGAPRNSRAERQPVQARGR
ncbi:MAG: hydantoinase/oxoprolinase family protein [Actinomycetota bacterium]